jgi:hypothetical protein
MWVLLAATPYPKENCAVVLSLDQLNRVTMPAPGFPVRTRKAPLSRRFNIIPCTHAARQQAFALRQAQARVSWERQLSTPRKLAAPLSQGVVQ